MPFENERRTSGGYVSSNTTPQQAVKVKLKNAQNEKQKKLHGFSFFGKF